MSVEQKSKKREDAARNVLTGMGWDERSHSHSLTSSCMIL